MIRWDDLSDVQKDAVQSAGKAEIVKQEWFFLHPKDKGVEDWQARVHSVARDEEGITSVIRNVFDSIISTLDVAPSDEFEDTQPQEVEYLDSSVLEDLTEDDMYISRADHVAILRDLTEKLIAAGVAPCGVPPKFPPSLQRIVDVQIDDDPNAVKHIGGDSLEEILDLPDPRKKKGFRYVVGAGTEEDPMIFFEDEQEARVRALIRQTTYEEVRVDE